MHVTRVKSRVMNKAGQERVYESVLLRRSYREDGKVKHATLANLSALPDTAIEDLRASLAGKTLIVAGDDLIQDRSLHHGHVAAVWAQAAQLGLPALLGPASPQRDIVLALIIARVCQPVSKLATTLWWQDTTLAEDLGVDTATTDDVYAAMDWLAGRQESIEVKLARKHLSPQVNPHRLALFDLSSSWVTGTKYELAARGYSRDGKMGLPQIEYGLLTDPEGRPVAIRVVAGNTADPTAFEQIAKEMKTVFGVDDMVMVGGRGMITTARINGLKEIGGLGWVTALRSSAIRKLVQVGQPVQPTLFDEVNFVEITHPDYPAERLVACRNPALADRRAHKREALLAATEQSLDLVANAVAAGRLTKEGDIGLRVGKIIGKYKMAKHFLTTIDDGVFSYTRNEESITEEKKLDGIYIVRTSIPDTQMDAGTVVGTYKSLALVERNFRSIKSIDLDLRPIYHRTETRVRAHVFICMLAAYLVWHLRAAWAPLTFTDENRPEPADPVAPAKRSTAAQKKASTGTTATGQAAYDFTSLLGHLSTLTRSTMRTASRHDQATLDLVTIATEIQRQAFELIGKSIPTTLK